MGNTNLIKAKREKNDEFYTQLTDIEKELTHYKEQFKGKTVYCNCDNPKYDETNPSLNTEGSNFWNYFYLNFEFLGLKKLITTHYSEDNPTYKLQYDGNKVVKTYLKDNGDFRSNECIELLKESDMIVTNPPFSLFREYIAQIMEYEKKFLVIGNYGSVVYKEIFPLIKENKIWTGMSPRSMSFKTPEGDIKTVNAKWFTNLDIPKRHEELILYKKYNPEYYPKYVNFNGIEVSRVTDIPMDYEGYMGVPITFIENYNPYQFELIGHSLDLAESMDKFAEKGEYMQGGPKFYLEEQDKEYKYRRLYDRIIIKNKKVVK